MNKIFSCLVILAVLCLSISCNVPGNGENTLVLMKTSLGDIKLSLYDETPHHRDNFIKHVNSGFFEGISFHRIINGFMIQAGDPDTRTVPVDKSADSLYTYTIPSEFNKDLFHRKGALAAAREGNEVNPEMRSSGTHFYIVQGTILTDDELDIAEQRINSNIKQAMFNRIIRHLNDSVAKTGASLTEAEIQELASVRMFDFLSANPSYKIPDYQREIYKTTGGVPRLDGTYTVFGEVVEGLEIVDKIAAVETGTADRPVNDVRILKVKLVRK